jgi:hypothetical protein
MGELKMLRVKREVGNELVIRDGVLWNIRGVMGQLSQAFQRAVSDGALAELGICLWRRRTHWLGHMAVIALVGVGIARAQISPGTGYINPAMRVVGSNAVQIQANAAGLVAAGLSHMSIAELQEMSDGSLVAVWAVNPSAMSSAAQRAGTYVRLSNAISARVGSGKLYASGGKWVQRCNNGCTIFTQADWNTFVALYTVMLTNESAKIPLIGREREREAIVQAAAVSESGIGPLGNLTFSRVFEWAIGLNAAWEFGQKIGGMVAQAIQDYAPEYYNEIGANVESLVQAFTDQQAIGVDATIAMTQFEIQLQTSAMGYPAFTNLQMPDGEIGFGGSMTAGCQNVSQNSLCP